MKKITSIFAAILLMGTVLFFACKKDKPAPVVDTCSTLSTTLAPDIATAQAAFTAYSTSPTPTNCVALKVAANTLSSKASVCPAIIALPNIQALIAASAALPCTAP